MVLSNDEWKLELYKQFRKTIDEYAFPLILESEDDDYVPIECDGKQVRVLTPHVYRDKSGTVKIYDWYDENECYGQWKLDDVLGWYPLDQLEKELDKGEG